MARLFSDYMFGGPFSGAQAGARLAGLKQSLAYRQADWRGQQRMEQMESMGLPYNTDPQQVRRESAISSAMGGRPIYSTVMPMPFGTWGGFGQGQPELPVKLKEQIGIPTKQEQPEQKPSPQPTPQPARTPRSTGYIQSQYGTGFSRTPMGFTGEPASFTSGGQYFGMAPKPTPTSTPIPFPELNTRNYFSSTMGNLKFPFANY